MKKLLLTSLIGLSVGALAGCGTSSEANDSAAEGGQATESSEQAATETSSYPRTITHAMGEIELEEKPSRIASVDIMITDYLLVLDETPIASEGISTRERSEIFGQYAEGKDITDLGGKVNLETIVERDPDLMLMSSESKKTGNYDQFNSIANTAVIDFSQGVRGRLTDIAEIVGKEEKAKEVLADLDAKVAEAKEVASEYQGETVLFLISNGKDFTVMHPEEFPIYYEEIGLTPVEGLPTEDNGRIGIEALSELNPDHIFIAENRRSMNADDLLGLINVWQENEVWKGLTAVENDQVYPVDTLVGDTFFLGQVAGVDSIIEELGK